MFESNAEAEFMKTLPVLLSTPVFVKSNLFTHATDKCNTVISLPLGPEQR